MELCRKWAGALADRHLLVGKLHMATMHAVTAPVTCKSILMLDLGP
jgi:hypothetical protein